MSNLHLTPLQWFSILTPILLLLVTLLRWLGQRGKPAVPLTYRQGCIGGLMLGLMFGMMIGVAIAFYVQAKTFR